MNACSTKRSTHSGTHWLLRSDRLWLPGRWRLLTWSSTSVWACSSTTGRAGRSPRAPSCCPYQRVGDRQLTFGLLVRGLRSPHPVMQPRRFCRSPDRCCVAGCLRHLLHLGSSAHCTRRLAVGAGRAPSCRRAGRTAIRPGRRCAGTGQRHVLPLSLGRRVCHRQLPVWFLTGYPKCVE